MTIQEMLNDLIETGLSQGAIAELCGSTQPTICRALQGSTPRYDLGKAIEKLHEQTKQAAAVRAA